MSILAKVWGGPFKAPPMVQPVSVGWVFLKILETVWRLFIIVCASLVLLLGYLWASEGPTLSSQVRVKVGEQFGTCKDKEFPIPVLVRNESDQTLGEIALRLRVYQRGNSEDVASYMSSTPRLTDILGPNRELFYCFRMPQVEPGSTGPYTVSVGVTYASELSKNVPIAAEPPPSTRTDGAIEPRMPHPWWGKPLGFVGVILFFGLLLSGGLGLVALIDTLLGTMLAATKSGTWPYLVAAAVNGVLVVAGSYALGALGLDGWVNGIDTWSRSSGFADGGVVLLTGVACQWPWVLWLALPYRVPAQRSEKLGSK